MENRIQNTLRMTRIAYILFTLLLTTISLNELNATHIIGGDLSYECLGDNEYEFTLTMRRDCDNGDPEATFDDPAVLGIFDSNGSLVVDLGNDGGLDMAFAGKYNIKSSLFNECIVPGPELCIEESIYKVKAFLPFRPGGYIIAYQRCCRNITLLNIEEPLNTGGTYFVRIGPKSYEECNSGPSWDAWPDIYICADEPYSFVHSATDPEGDSLVYRLCTPTAGASNDYPRPQPPFIPENDIYPYFETVTWSNIFDETNMFGSGVPLTIDSETGELTATPGMIGQFLVGVCVEEYRDGQLMGWLRRDFEVNIQECGDPSAVDFDFEFEDCNDLTVNFTNLSENFDSYEWNFNHPDDDPAFMSTEENPTFQFPTEGNYQVQLTGLKNDGCSINIIKNVSAFNGNIQVGFDAFISGCLENSVTLMLADTSSSAEGIFIETYEWVILLDGVQQDVNNASTITLDDVLFETLDVTLNGVTNEGCPVTTSESYTLNDLLPNAAFNAQVLQCYANGFQVQLTDMSTAPNATPEMWIWTVSTSSNSEMYMGANPTIDVVDGATVELEVTFSNGCVAYANQVLNITEELLPSLEFETSAQSCDEDDAVFSVLINPLISGGTLMAEITDYNWSVIDDGGFTTVYTTEEIVVDLITNGSAEVTLIVNYDNGCSITETTIVQAGNYLPSVDIALTSVECLDDDTVSAQFESIVDGVGTVVDTAWTILNDGQTQEFNGQNIQVELNANSDVEVTVTLTLDNDCQVSATETFEMGGVAAVDPTIDITIDDCTDQNTVMITLTNTTEPQNLIESTDWSYTINGVAFSDSGNSVMITLAHDDILGVDMTVNFTNSCSVTLTEEDLQLDIPSVVFSGEPVLSCEGMQVPLILNGNPDWTYTWEPTDGLTFDPPGDFSNPLVAASDPVIYNVTVTNGVCSVEESVMVVTMTNEDLEISGEEYTCDGNYTLTVDAIEGIVYEWSNSPTFTSIIATGPTLVGQLDPNSSFETFYVRIQDDNPLCLVGSQSFVVNDGSVCLELVQPFVICQGDTSQYVAINCAPDQIVTMDWVDDPRIIDETNGMTPLIGISSTEEDFYLYLNATNQFGCTMSDSLLVDVQEQPDIAYSFEFVECGELTVCFTPEDGDLYIWNFGDPASGGENDAIGNGEICHTFSDYGTYDVTMSGVGAVCAGIPVVQTVALTDFGSITIDGFDADTTTICGDEMLTFNIDTDVPAEFITWCLGEGNTVTGTADLILIPAETMTGSGVAMDTWLVMPTDQTVVTDEVIVKVQTSESCVYTDSLAIDVYDFGPNTAFENLSFEYLGFDCETGLVCFEANTDVDGAITWEITGDDFSTSAQGILNPCFDFAGTGSGTYMVSISAPGAPCPVNPYSESISIQDMPFVDILNVEDETIEYCVGDEITLTAISNAQDSQISWCDSDNVEIATGSTYTFTPTETGQISVKLNGGGECVDTSVVMFIPYDFGPGTEIEDLDFTFNQPDCDEDVICFEANTDADGALIWTITGNGTQETILGDQFPCYDFALTGSGTYMVELSAPNAPCPVNSVTQEIMFGSQGDLSVLGFDDSIVNYCVGDSVTLTATSNAANPIFSWCSDGVEIAQNETFTFLGDDYDNLSVKLNTGGQCGDTLLLDIIPYDFGPGTENDSLSFTVEQPNCDELVVCFEANDDAGGFLEWVISGNGAEETILGDQFPCYDFALTGSGSYVIDLSAPNAPCPIVGFQDTIQIFDEIPEIDLLSEEMIVACEGDTVTLVAEANVGNEFITWCDANGQTVGTGDSLTIIVSMMSEYTAKVGDIAPCQDQVSVTITGVDVENAEIVAPDMDCTGEPVEVSVIGLPDGDFTFMWGPDTCFIGDITGQEALVDGTYSKEIFVEIIDNVSGCSTTLTDTLLLSGFGDLALEVSPNDTIFLGQDVDLSVVIGNPAWDYDWSTGDSGVGVDQITDTPSESTIYSVTITDENGCEVILEMLVTVLQPDCNDEDVFLPTAFSPNNDDVNDILFVRSNFILDMEFFVYDRWGEEVFRTTDINTGWDGTFQGEELAPDVYAYCVKVTCTNEEEFVKAGNVSLLR